MNMNEIRTEARKKMKGYCRVCPVCNGFACAGEVPGMGGSLTAQSFKDNIEELRKVKLQLKTIHEAKKPDTTTEIFGYKLSVPIIAAPVTGSSFNMGGA